MYATSQKIGKPINLADYGRYRLLDLFLFQRLLDYLSERVIVVKLQVIYLWATSFREQGLGKTLAHIILIPSPPVFALTL
jgi:hypothetical protein